MLGKRLSALWFECSGLSTNRGAKKEGARSAPENKARLRFPGAFSPKRKQDPGPDVALEGPNGDCSPPCT